MIDNIFNYIVLVQIKALLLLVLAFAIVRALKHFQAAHRQLVWRQLIALLMILPVLTVVLPSISFDLPTWGNSASAITELRKQPLPLTRPLSPAEPGQSPSSRSDAAAAQPVMAALIEKQNPLWQRIFIGVYLSIALGLGMRLLVGLTRAHLSIRKLSGVTLPGLPKSVEIRVNKHPETPFVWGLFKPVIVVPSDFSTYSQALQQNILHHEQTHVRNRDWLLVVLTKICCCVYWINPLIWQAARQSQLEAEKICDEQVVAAGQAEESYAEQLVHIAKTLRKPTDPQSLAPSMAGMSSLRHRIDNLLSNRRRRNMKPITQKCLKASFLLLSVFLVALNSQGQAPDNRDKQNIASEQPGYVRLRAVTPEYPTNAAKKGIEGYTVVEYDILSSGTVDNIRIVESEPVGLFDQASINALRKWLYMPAYREGKAVVSKDVRNRLTYKLDQFPKVSISAGELEYIQERGPQSAAEAKNLIKHYLATKNSDSATTVFIEYLNKSQAANLKEALYLIESVPFKKLDQQQIAKYIHLLRSQAEQDESGDKYALLAQLFRGMENWPAAQLSLMKAFERGGLSAPGATTYNLSVVLFNTHSYEPSLRAIDTAIAKYGDNERWTIWRNIVKSELDRKNRVDEQLIRAVSG